MLHLHTERLAALADDEPTATEAQHLAACARCARERNAHGALLALARREGGRSSPPVTDWNALSDELRREGLISPPAAPASTVARSIGGRGWMRAAAALLLVAAGVAAGRVSTGAPIFAFEPPSADTTETGPDYFGGDFVSNDVPTYSSTTEAVTAFLSAQRQMQHAASFLAERDQARVSEVDTRAYRARLTATDGMVVVARAALYEAPADPYVNQYYLSSLSAREAAMRQMGRAVPPGAQLIAY
jgi:hypothetical protein